MASDETKGEKPPNPTIEEHARNLGTPAWALAGVKVRERWAEGQRVTEATFKAAVEKFLKSPTDGGSA